MGYISEEFDIPKYRDYEIIGKLLSTLYEKYGVDPDDWMNVEEFSHLPFSQLPSRLNSLLPKTKSDMKRILLSARRSKESWNFALAVAKEMSVEKRSIKWIEKHGVCLDNFSRKKSTNPQAGMGAIAKRFMKRGEVIAPAPILHVTNRDALRMPAFYGEQWQLILNYCVGHEHSSLLLCPNTNVGLINHCSERRPKTHPCGRGKGPNAKYRWAEWNKISNNWRSKLIGEMEQDGGKGLMMEVVATRNIEDGEEVFIDYGKFMLWHLLRYHNFASAFISTSFEILGINFEKAWDEHVRSWNTFNKKNQSHHERISVKELNDAMGPLKLAPDFGLEYTSTDSGGILFTGCFYNENDERFWTDFDSNEPWEGMTVGHIIHRYGASYGDEFNVDDESEDGLFWPCVVARQEQPKSLEDADAYTVRIVQLASEPMTIWERKKLPRIIRHFPRKSIRHFYLPYSSDIHLRHAFRHHIELSDDMFPASWKNKQPST